MTKSLDQFVAYYIDRLEGSEAENAFHSLIEAPKEAMPLLVEAYNKQTSPSKRELILEIICEFRDPAVLALLANALRDESDEIWKQALDGLVTIGGDTALEILRKEKGSLPVTSKKAEWIYEAIGQIREGFA